MGANLSEEKIAAQEEAMQRSEWERQRIDYYRSLRYKFDSWSVDDWLDDLFNQKRMIYKAQKNPSSSKVRKEAGIGFFENVLSYASNEKKKELDKRKAVVRKKLQNEVDEANEVEYKRCNAYNTRLRERLANRLKKLDGGDAFQVEEYFSFVLNQDSYLLDGNDYPYSFNIVYNSEDKQLVIDYRLPCMEEVSRVKEWKVDKNNDVVPKEMNKTDYLEMYERVLFDISLRVVGIIFESDTSNVVENIVFNGSCVYKDWQELPTIILSFEMSKKQYSYRRVQKMDYISKVEISKLKNANYIDDLSSNKAPSDLWECPPSKLVVPIKSSFQKD